MAIRFLTSQNIQAGTLTVSTIANLATASNLFLVSDGGLVKYRTAAQVRSDIGAGTGSGSVTSVAVTNGTGISASVANSTTTPNITITNTDLGSSQAIFKNFAVLGQSTVVADTNNDTLTLVAGSNVTITTNASTDTITIASSYVDSNNYPTSLGWDTATGILTLGRNGLSALTVDLDGRYVTSSGVTSVGGTAPIVSSGGTTPAISITAATTGAAGSMSAADKTKLDGIAAGAQVNVATNLGITAGTTAGPIVTSSTGTNATLPTASATASGVVTTGAQTWAGDKTFNSNVTANKYIFGSNNMAIGSDFSNNITLFGFNSTTFKFDLGSSNIALIQTTLDAISFANNISANNLSGTNTGDQTTISGNAATATILQTTRTINGTGFNGSANIATSYWGTTRTITIGNTGKSVNGSGNVSWTLAEIGAQATLTNPVTGTGTTNYVPKFTGSTSLGNSQIYDNGTNVGIGITSPTSRVHSLTSAAGPVSYDFRCAVFGYNTATSTVYPNSVGVAGRVLTSDGRAIYGDATTGGGWGGYFDGKGYFSGYVGIGTTSPSEKLDVAGDILINGITIGRGSGNVSSNTTNGFEALRFNTTGSQNAANGYQALGNNTTGSYNTANGSEALRFNTTGSSNTANGYQSLLSNTTGEGNVANGFWSLRSNITGAQNVANGYQSLYANTTGNNNVAVGYLALRYNTTGSNNTSIGTQSLYNNVTGDSNVSNGVNSLYNNTTGNFNTGVGSEALYSNTIGFRNTAFGYQTLRTNVDDNGLTAIGYSALYSNNGGGLNTAVGYQALYSNTVANENTAVGSSTLGLTVGGGRNTAVGSAAMLTNVGGSNNLALGTDALRNATANSNTAVGSYSLRTNINGSNNVAVGKDSGTFLSNGTTEVTATTNGVFIGSGTSPAANGQNNQIVIGYQAIGIGSNSVVIGNDSITKTLLKGNVGIGTTTTNYKLEVNNTSAGNLTTALTLNNGSTTTNTAVALRLQTDPTSTVNSYSEIRSTRTNSPTTGGVTMQFLNTSSTYGSASEMMRLNYLGLGIGTAGTTTITESRLGRFADGTAATPAYSFSDDTNNGMYRITTDTLGFSTAGSEKLRISSAGDVGIGTSSPNQKLHVNGATQLGDINATTNFNTVALKVVEGTISTGPTLGSGTVGAQAVLYSNGTFGMYTGVSSTGSTWMQSQRNDAGTSAYNILLNPLGGNVGIGATLPSEKLEVNGDIAVSGNNKVYSKADILTLMAGGTGGTYLTIDDTAGGVGIGTTSPSYELDVDGTIRASSNLYLGSYVYHDADTNTYFGFPTNDTYAVRTNGSDRLYINSSGKVGIGTTNPLYPLYVNGNTFGTSIYASNDIVAFSDISVKENIRSIENVIERVQKSRGVLYDRNDCDSKNNIGFIAQELEVAFPELVITNEDGTKAVKYQNAVAVMFEAIKEQQKQIDELKELITKLIK